MAVTTPTGGSFAGLRVVFDAARTGAGFWLSGIERDGHPSGSLQYLTVDAQGLIQLHYDSGESVDHARLVVARPALADRCQRVGTTAWRCADPFNTPVMAMPGRHLTGVLVQRWLATDF